MSRGINCQGLHYSRMCQFLFKVLRVETRLNHIERTHEEGDDTPHSDLYIFTKIIKPLYARRCEELNLIECVQAIIYVLKNYEKILEFIR